MKQFAFDIASCLLFASVAGALLRWFQILGGAL